MKTIPNDSKSILMKISPLGIHLLLFLLLSQLSFSQNLVKNPGFERHKVPQCLICHKSEQFNLLVPDWETPGMYAHLLTKRYQFNSQEKYEGFDMEKYKPFSGNAMVMLQHYSRTNKALNRGGGDYLQTKLKSPLISDGIYKISYKIYIKKYDGLFEYPNFPRHFGICFLSENAKFKKRNLTYYSNDIITIEQTEPRKWHEISFYFQPTQTYEYIMLGCFDSDFLPINFVIDNNGLSFHFFIDDISIEPVDEPLEKPAKLHRDRLDENPALKAIAEARFKPFQINFEHNSDALDPQAKLTLDSFANTLKKESVLHTFLIQGHTDNVGSSIHNQELSKNRARKVRDFLIQQSGLSENYFELESLAANQNIATNKTEDGRGKNRRVEILKGNSELPRHFYYLATKAHQNEKTDSVFIYLKNWMAHNDSDKILLLNDPDFEDLTSHQKWKALEFFTKKYYSRKYRKGVLAFLLDDLYIKDQMYRTMASKYKHAKGVTPKILKELTIKQQDHFFEKYDPINLKKAIDFLEKYGLPTKAEVGKRAIEAPLNAILHWGKIEVYEKYKPLVEKAFKRKDIHPEKYANYIDRMNMKKTGLQIYGTQYTADTLNENWFELAPMIDSTTVDSLRIELGLGTITMRRVKIVEK